MFCDTTFERGEGGTKLNNIQDRVTDYTHEHNDHASIVIWKDERRVEPGLLNDDVDAKDEADVAFPHFLVDSGVICKHNNKLMHV